MFTTTDTADRLRTVLPDLYYLSKQCTFPCGPLPSNHHVMQLTGVYAGMQAACKKKVVTTPYILCLWQQGIQ